MNIIEKKIILYLLSAGKCSQREIALSCNISLGSVNKALKSLKNAGYLGDDLNLTEKSKKEIKAFQPKKAIILAAGYGMRMVPINFSIPKAMLEVRGEVLIERIITQLHEVGVFDIQVVVGFMKESFEYLIDKYHVKLVINPLYKERDNLYSLSLASKNLENTYIIPSNIWCGKNPFSKHELYSWYMVSEKNSIKSDVKVTKGLEMLRVAKNCPGQDMIGIAYVGPDISKQLEQNVQKLKNQEECSDAFWEEASFDRQKMLFYAKEVLNKDFFKITNYEELKNFDENSSSLNNEAIRLIEQVFHISSNEIQNIMVLKKGMTNRSFLFEVQGQKYIMRIPGEGTDRLINRKEEYAVYQAIESIRISDDVIYINPENGYKITRFIEGARVCNPDDVNDLNVCMRILKNFHQKALRVDHTFDLFQQIIFYESLRGESIYKDYEMVKQNVLALKPFIEKHKEPFVLTHIDAVPDNFLLYTTYGEEQIKLIDWEYAGMQDPHVDIAMFAIYAMYDKEQIDRLIDIYFDGTCEKNIRIKIYCYIAVCGLLWSNWCEYKRSLGVDFGEYSIRQYRYAKEYTKYAKKLMEE